MMRQKEKGPTTSNSKKKRQKKQQRKLPKENVYDESDLEGMQVKNSMVGLEAGESTVLTLADAPILQTKTHVANKVVGINEEEDALENIGLSEQEKQQDGLRKKRMLEMGMGRAGGYAGFDDEEFEELGGTLGPSREERGSHFKHDEEDSENQNKSHGFRIGSRKIGSAADGKTDLDKVQRGESISLVWKGDVVTSDYMTKEEEEQESKGYIKRRKQIRSSKRR